MRTKKFIQCGMMALFAYFQFQPAIAQTEVMAWSNIIGVRVDGELVDFESSLRVGDIKTYTEATQKERQHPRYHRDGKTQEVTTRVRYVDFIQKVTDIEKGHVRIKKTNMKIY